MLKCEKILRKATASPTSLKFGELCYLAECHGFRFVRQSGGSHRIYKSPGYPFVMNFQSGKGGMAKPYQVRQLLKVLDEFENGD